MERLTTQNKSRGAIVLNKIQPTRSMRARRMHIWISVACVILGAVSAADTFRFTQCECPNFEFSSEEKINFPNPFEISGSGSQFSCPGDGEFPEESGLIFDSSSTNGKLSTSGVSSSLFQDTLGNRIGWHAAFRASISPVEDAQFNVIEILANDESVLTVTLRPFFSGNQLLNINVLSNIGVSVSSDRFESIGDIPIDIVVGEFINGRLDGSNELFNGSFGCVSLSTNDFDCASSFFQMSDISNVKINMFEPTSSIAMPLKVSMVNFGNGFTDDPVGPTLITALASSAAEIRKSLPSVISLPGPIASTLLNTDEDIPLNSDISTLVTGGTLSSEGLNFSITEDAANGIINSINIPEIIYTPNKDFNGQDSFNFTYGITTPFVCSNTITSTIDITPVPDPPVAKDIEVEAFANTPTLVTQEVGTDVDGELDGRFVITNSIPGLISQSCSSQDAVQELSLVNGSVTFCYTPDNSLIDDTSARLTFTITDGDDLSSDGSITFIGNNPFFAPEQSPVQVGSEEGAISFSLGDARYGRKAPGSSQDLILGIRIVKVPEDIDGELTTADGTPVDNNQEFSELDSLQFKPRQNVFNAFQGQPLGPSGVPVRDCAKKVALNGQDGYCAISFKYVLFFGKVDGRVLESFFLINAVDDGNPSITMNGESDVEMKVDGFSSENDVFNKKLTSQDITVSSDAGADVFGIKMRIQAGDGTSFVMNDIENKEGFKLSKAFLGVIPQEDCSGDGCTLVDLLGTPAQLQEIVKLLSFKVPSDKNFPSLNFQVASASEEFKQGFDLTIELDLFFKKPKFGDSKANVIGLASSIVGISMGVVIGGVLWKKHLQVLDERAYLESRNEQWPGQEELVKHRKMLQRYQRENFLFQEADKPRSMLADRRLQVDKPRSMLADKKLEP